MSAYNDLRNRFDQHITACKLCGTSIVQDTKWGLCPVGKSLKT